MSSRGAQLSSRGAQLSCRNLCKAAGAEGHIQTPSETPLASRFNEPPAVVEERSVGILPALDGPILADFLAMGAGGGTVPAELAVGAQTSVPEGHECQTIATMSRTNDLRVPVSATSNENEYDGPIIVRERRLVGAALQRREALEPAVSEKLPRTPLSRLPLRTLEQVPPLFTKGYQEYLDACKKDASSSSASRPGTLSSTVKESRHTNAIGDAAVHNGSSLRKMRIKVLYWHRSELQKKICKNIFFNFLQDCRMIYNMQPNKPPLWFWEKNRAEEHSLAGQIILLVQYLAETELHMKLGPERRSCVPGSMQPAQAVKVLQAERRRLAPEWNVKAHTIEEDELIRVFLDGCLTWPRVRSFFGDLLMIGPTPQQSDRHSK